jgi:hypothetical protein
MGEHGIKPGGGLSLLELGDPDGETVRMEQRYGIEKMPGYAGTPCAGNVHQMRGRVQ